MATTKLTYNDIYLRLSRLQDHLDSYNAPLDAEGQANDPVYQALLKEKALLQKQLKAATPKTKYSEEDAAKAQKDINDLPGQIRALQAKGVSDSDPRIAKLSQQLKQSRQVLSDWQKDPNQPETIKSNADKYVKDQNAQLATKQAQQKQQADNAAQLTKLQKERDDAQALGQDTSAIDKQIAALQNQGTGAKQEPKPSIKTGAELAASQFSASSASNPSGSSGQSGKSAGTGGTSKQPAKTVTTIDKATEMKTLAQQYGALGAMAMQPGNEWMNKILTEAATAPGGAWTKQKFLDAIQADPHWAAMGQSMQKAQEDFYGSGGAAWYTSYDRLWNMMKNNALAQGLDPSALGPELQATDVAGIKAAFSDPNNPVTTYLNMHYADSSALNDPIALGHYVATHAKIAYNPASGTPQGDLAANVINLRGVTNDWGMSGVYTDKQLQDYALKMQQGVSGYDINSFTSQQRANAIATYKPFADALSKGNQTLAQLASPYITTMAGLLEIDPSNIDLGSTTGYGSIVSKAMMGDGTTAVDPLSFANQVRSLPQWLNTQNAQKTLLSAGDQIIAKLGLG